jgi:DNA polymerase-1
LIKLLGTIGLMDRLVLVDAHAIIHRAYYALPPMHTSFGEPTNAVYGFLNMLLRVVSDLKPTYLAVAFDLPAPTFRHKEYIAYQAHRPEMEDELKSQVVRVKELVNAASIPIYEKEGYEADDIIGTLAKQAVQDSKQNLVKEVIIVTGDRDMLQLVDEKVKVYAPIKGLSQSRLFDAKEVEEYMGVAPDKIVDYKALVGDQSDNYPGVPGIGPKTAIELLRKFGNLENIYKSLENIPPAVNKKLKEGYESAMLSQRLATIVTNAPVKLDLEKAIFNDPFHNKAFIDKLRELGFRSLVKRLTGEEIKQLKSKSKKSNGNGQMGLI